jgi:hypothetical protein
MYSMALTAGARMQEANRKLLFRMKLLVNAT